MTLTGLLDLVLRAQVQVALLRLVLAALFRLTLRRFTSDVVRIRFLHKRLFRLRVDGTSEVTALLIRVAAVVGLALLAGALNQVGVPLLRRHLVRARVACSAVRGENEERWVSKCT